GIFSNTAVGNIGKPFADFCLSVKKNDLLVAEVSSFQLEAVNNFKPHIGVLLNITPDHIDRHKTFVCYIETKKRLFINQDENDFAVLNYDDPNCRAVETRAKKIWFSKNEILCEGVFIENGLIKVKYLNINETVVDLNDICIMTDNAMAATAISICAGKSVVKIAETLKSFKGVEHRLEYVAKKYGITFINDSKATNVDAAVKGLQSVGMPVVLIGGGFDKKADFNEWTSLFTKKVRELILIGETSKKIAESCESNNFYNYECAKSLEEAVKLAYKKAQPGDCVLLSPACASWDMFNDFEQRGNLYKRYVENIE
ncbi:MAG: UDP-N-acetylmuramoyl-L-alanine--D-glutamate ligase, partial [Defluviitaleaceae bacterium]|nr:UDP-N-acetylmuramoyl-L-alanine--D-glutamate ligase [Defluviitaleaceae bacterium]